MRHAETLPGNASLEPKAVLSSRTGRRYVHVPVLWNIALGYLFSSRSLFMCFNWTNMMKLVVLGGLRRAAVLTVVLAPRLILWSDTLYSLGIARSVNQATTILAILG